MCLIGVWQHILDCNRKIPEQQATDTNPLFDLAIIPRDLQTTLPHSSSARRSVHTHTHQRVSQIYFVLSKPLRLFHYIDDAYTNAPFLLQSRISCQTPIKHIISTCEPSYVISITHRLSFPDDGSYVIRNMLE